MQNKLFCRACSRIPFLPASLPIVEFFESGVCQAVSCAKVDQGAFLSYQRVENSGIEYKPVRNRNSLPQGALLRSSTFSRSCRVPI